MSEGLLYDVRKGVLWLVSENGDKTVLGRGYSGHPPYVNDPTAEALVARGPIPRGSYRVLRAFAHVRLGPVSMFLEPIRDTDMRGRSGFFIHGDNEYGNQTASHGCIILPRKAREAIDALDRKRGLILTVA